MDLNVQTDSSVEQENMEQKIRIILLFGGQSCEHEVSVTSAGCIYDALDSSRFDVTPIGIAKSGRWVWIENPQPVFDSKVVSEEGNRPVILDYRSRGKILVLDERNKTYGSLPPCDVIFPILHGPYGEDGTVQGLLELSRTPFIGAGVTGSAVAMNKAVAQAVCASESIPQANYLVFNRSRWDSDRETVVQEIENSLHYPLFIKPSSLGSSVGISKVRDGKQLKDAMDFAAKFDLILIVEEGFEDCYEVEVSVIGNDEPQASVVGEIIPGAEFYDYDDKYINDVTEFEIPANLPDTVSEQVRDYAIRAYTSMKVYGLARVDFFVDKETHQVYLNEINTMPGFTPISMYPKLWMASGTSYADLISELIEHAKQRRREQDRTQYVL